MRAEAAMAGLAVDPKALGELRRHAATDPQGALREVAGQFETMLLNIVVKSMRATVPGEGPMDSASTRMFTDMLDQQFVQGMGAQGGLGLAELLVRQLGQLRGGAGQEGGSPVDTNAAGGGAR